MLQQVNYLKKFNIYSESADIYMLDLTIENIYSKFDCD